MEMTPGQIMEAEISASTLGLEDDDTVQPQEPATSSSSLRLQGHVHPDQDHLGSDTLPEDLFTSDVNQPPSPAAAAIVQVRHYLLIFEFILCIISNFKVNSCRPISKTDLFKFAKKLKYFEDPKQWMKIITFMPTKVLYF